MSLKIVLTSKPNIITKSLTEVGANGVYTASNARYINLYRGLRANTVKSSIAVIINSGQVSCLSRLSPDQQAIQSLAFSLKKMVQKINEKCKNAKEQISAFIVGGIEFDRCNNESVKSYDLANTAANFFEKNNIPFTMIFGKKEGMKPDDINLVNGKVLLSNTDLELSKEKISEGAENYLTNYYQFVEINPAVPIMFS